MNSWKGSPHEPHRPGQVPRPRFTRGDIITLVFIGLGVAYFAAHIAYAALVRGLP